MVRLIAAGAIAPVNIELIPNYEDVYDGPQAAPVQLASAGSRSRCRSAARRGCWCGGATPIPGTLASLGALLDPPQVASLRRAGHRPRRPALDRRGGAVGRRASARTSRSPTPTSSTASSSARCCAILRLQHPYVERVLARPGRRARRLPRRPRVASAWPRRRSSARSSSGPGDLGPIGSTRPREGSTGVSPAWMIAAKAKHPNCLYRFLDRALDPEVNAQTALDAGIAPANKESCDVLERRGNERHCELYRADEDDFYGKVLFRTYPDRRLRRRPRPRLHGLGGLDAGLEPITDRRRLNRAPAVPLPGTLAAQLPRPGAQVAVGGPDQLGRDPGLRLRRPRRAGQPPNDDLGPVLHGIPLTRERRSAPARPR